MARPKAKVPTRQYRISGQSVVRIAGRDFYLGPHDSAESIGRYAVLVGIYQSNGLTLPDDFDAASLDVQAAALLGHPRRHATVTVTAGCTGERFFDLIDHQHTRSHRIDRGECLTRSLFGLTDQRSSTFNFHLAAAACKLSIDSHLDTNLPPPPPSPRFSYAQAGALPV